MKRHCPEGPRRERPHLSVGAATILAILALWVMLVIAAMVNAASAATLGTVTVQLTRAAQSTNYVTVQPYPGAADYIAYDPAHPHDVKAFGLDYTKRNGDGTYTTPVTTVQWQGLSPGKPQTLVVAALDRVYPMAAANAVNGDFTPEYPAAPTGGAMAGMGTGIPFGSNCGPSIFDPKTTATNGQGAPANVPHVIAVSAPFTVTCTGKLAFPSSNAATQVHGSGFSSGVFGPIVLTDPSLATGTQTLKTGNGLTWTITYSQLAFAKPGDTLFTGAGQPLATGTLSQTFVHRNHLMDVTFDGGPPNVPGQPAHVAHGYWGISPNATFDISGGRWLHVVFDVDAYFEGRKCIEAIVWPAGDPPTGFYLFNGPLNRSNQMFVLTINDQEYTSTLAAGPVAPATPALTAVTGSLGQAPVWGPRFLQGSPDLMHHFDVWLSQTHETVFEEGQKAIDCDLPTPLPFSACGFNVGHEVYHTALAVQETAQYDPGNYFELGVQPYSDERHWDSIGGEVLPAGTAPQATVP